MSESLGGRGGTHERRPPAAGPAGAAQSGAGDCVAHAPTTSGEYQIGYTAGCSGHDESELDPVSGLAGSARDLTWTAVLPSDGTVPVSAVGPTFGHRRSRGEPDFGAAGGGGQPITTAGPGDSVLKISIG